MHEELVKALRNCDEGSKYCCFTCPEDCNGPCQENLMKKAADAIESTRQDWIPVTERLPEEKKRTYWVCTDTGYQCECRWTNNIFGIGESGEWGWCIVDVPQYLKVTAWMPLHEPYKPPKEE